MAARRREGAEGISANLFDFLLGDFCKRKDGTTLQVDIARKAG